MSRVRYAAWRLEVESASRASNVPEDVESISHSEGSDFRSESVIGRDERTLVDRNHFMPGGKYRCIVKLFLKYEKSLPDRWSIATGWLIAPDVVVTAGHCAFNWSRSQGRVVRVRAYIGYYGKLSTRDMEGNQVQLRFAESVLTTSEWVEKSKQRERDVAFFKLATPFDIKDSNRFSFQSTEARGNELLGVVGYPGDLIDAQSGERGALMYESFERVSWDLAIGIRQMLYYNIDTYGGNSGSPVLRDTNVSIGVHCYGGEKNHASVIGKYGNSFIDMKRALDVFSRGRFDSGVFILSSASADTREWLNFVDVTSSEPFVLINKNNATNGTEAEDGETESISNGGVDPYLIKTFKTALHQGKSRDFDKTPLGPIAPHLGALAGIALNAAGDFGRPGTETESSEVVLESGVAERAILGEAAIASIVKLGPRKAKEEGLFDIMSKVVRKIGPVVQRVAPKVLGAIKDSALNIAISELNGLKDPLPTKTEAGDFKIQIEPRKPRFNQRAESIESEAGAFVEGLLASVRSSSKPESEEFLGFLGPLLGAGLGLAKGILENADEGLEAIGESFIEAEDIDPFRQPIPEFDGLGARAVLGEAALEALLQFGPEKMQEEGLFDVFKKVIKTTGKAVLKHGPKVVETVLPIVSNLVGAEAGAEDFLEGGRKGAEAESDFLSRLGDEAGESGENAGGSPNGGSIVFPAPIRLTKAPLKVKYVTRDKVNFKIGEASWEFTVPNLSIPEGLVTLEIYDASGISNVDFPVEELRVSIGKAEAPDWTPPEMLEFTDDSVVGGVLNWDQKAFTNKRFHVEVVGHPTHPPLNRFNIDTFVVPDLQAALYVTTNIGTASH